MKGPRMIDPLSNLIWLALEAAITEMDAGPYWPGIAGYLAIEDRNGRVVVVSAPGYTGQSTEPVINGYAFFPAGGGYPESLRVAAGPLTGEWVRCPLCGVYAALKDRGMHYTIFGHIPLACHDCRDPREWTTVNQELCRIESLRG